MNFINAYILSLNGEVERRNWITDKLSDKFNLYFFPAVNGRKFKLKLNHNLINSPAIATFISHTTLMLYLKNIDGYNLILEDDSDFIGESEKDIISKINTLPDDWDIAFLGWYANSTLIKPKKVNNDWCFVNGFWGLHAYIVNKKSTDKIYNLLLDIDTHIDLQLSRLISSRRISAYFLNKPLFDQYAKFESQIKHL